MRLVLPVILFLGLFALVPRAAAQHMAVPVSVQVPLLLKVLGFDRTLAERAPAQVIIGVLYQGRFRTSARVADEVREELSAGPATIGGTAVRVVGIDLDTADDLGTVLLASGVHVLYVTPLRAVALEQLTAIADARQVTTMTGVPDYVEDGVTIGIDLRGDRPQIVVNLPGARASGTAFSSQLLKLARLAGPDGGPR